MGAPFQDTPTPASAYTVHASLQKVPTEDRGCADGIVRGSSTHPGVQQIHLQSETESLLDEPVHADPSAQELRDPEFGGTEERCMPFPTSLSPVTRGVRDGPIGEFGPVRRRRSGQHDVQDIGSNRSGRNPRGDLHRQEDSRRDVKLPVSAMKSSGSPFER